MKVLVADDSRTVRFILISLLRDLGVTDVDEAEDGRIAWQMCQQNNYSVVLSDIHMPGMTGLDLLAALRNSMKERLRQLPVVIVSSDSTYNCIEKAKQLGAKGYIKKPFESEGVARALRAAVPEEFRNGRKPVSRVVHVARDTANGAPTPIVTVSKSA